jgi:hypothetical protein
VRRVVPGPWRRGPARPAEEVVTAGSEVASS